MQKVSSLSKNILFLSIMAYLIVIFLPVFSVKGTLFNIMVLLSFLGFVAAVLLDGKINYLIISFLGLVIVFDFLIYKTQWVGLYSFANKMLLLFEFWFPCLVSVYMFSRHEEFSNQYRKKLVDLFLLIYAVTCITTIVGNDEGREKIEILLCIGHFCSQYFRSFRAVDDFAQRYPI